MYVLNLGWSYNKTECCMYLGIYTIQVMCGKGIAVGIKFEMLALVWY